MRVLFAGSPAIAVPTLKMLCACEAVSMAGVLTNPDTPRGRSGALLPTEVGEAAAGIVWWQAGLGRADFPILKPLMLDAQARECVRALEPDLLVSFAYGRIFGPKFLSLFPLGGINVHPSLLPKYRGPAPIQAAILNRDTVTGITVQRLAREMDSGDILAQEPLQLTGGETAGALGETVAQKAAQMLPKVLADIAEGNAAGLLQNHSEATYCPLIAREDGLIDWNRSAVEIDAMVRAYNPWPLCRTAHNGKELFILQSAVTDSVKAQTPGLVLGIDKQQGILVQTGEGILAVTELQYEAKKVLQWRAFVNGARDFIGAKLG